MGSKKNHKYNHKEAYCLMQYHCEECSALEVLYNARDGVTPFIIECNVCGGKAKHVKWREDQCDPNHVPPRGQRIFVSMTEEIARLFARYRLRKFEESGHPPPPEGTEERKKIEDSITESVYHDGEGPFMFVF